MGVKDLWQLLEPVGRRINIEALTNKHLAVGTIRGHHLLFAAMYTLASHACASHDHCSYHVITALGLTLTADCRCVDMVAPVHQSHAQ